MESEALFITNQEKVGLEKNGIKKEFSYLGRSRRDVLDGK